MLKMNSRNLKWTVLVSDALLNTVNMPILCLHSGWIDKHVLFPLLKACFSSQLKDQEIKHLLSSQALKSLVGIVQIREDM